MKIIYEGSGKWAQLVNEEKKIFGTDRDEYFDENGERIPREEIVFDPDEDDEEEAIWDSDWLEYEGTSEKLISESTVEIEWEIDDGFGTFGFKNRAGEFVIEPQYAYAHQFTCGLAAVNLNRTWYKTEKGDRYYENHYGYINERGETVIRRGVSIQQIRRRGR